MQTQRRHAVTPEDLSQQELEALGLVRMPDGRYMTVVTTPAGGCDLTPVATEEVQRMIGGSPDGRGGMSTAFSEVATDEYKLMVLAPVRKGALSPVVYMGQAFPVKQGWFQGDIGDWINHCCRFTLDKGYGVLQGMFTGRDLHLPVRRDSVSESDVRSADEEQPRHPDYRLAAVPRKLLIPPLFGGSLHSRKALS